MKAASRREFLEWSAAWSGAAWSGAVLLGSACQPAWADAPKLEIACFRADVSPPNGHPLCGGWIKPVEDSPLNCVELSLATCAAESAWTCVSVRLVIDVVVRPLSWLLDSRVRSTAPSTVLDTAFSWVVVRPWT
mgnify:CR=1 FL=1